MKFDIIDDGSAFDAVCDQLDEEEADKREAAIIKAVSESLAAVEVEEVGP